MGITLSMTGVFRETGASFFFIPKGALTHHLRSRRWYPSLRSGSCALRGGCGSCGSLQTMPHHLRVLLSLPTVLKVVWVKMTHPTSAPCDKPATGSFLAVMDGACCPSIFFFGKETKTRVRRFSVPRKGCDLLWQFIIWKQRS